MVYCVRRLDTVPTIWFNSLFFLGWFYRVGFVHCLLSYHKKTANEESGGNFQITHAILTSGIRQILTLTPIFYNRPPSMKNPGITPANHLIRMAFSFGSQLAFAWFGNWIFLTIFLAQLNICFCNLVISVVSLRLINSIAYHAHTGMKGTCTCTLHALWLAGQMILNKMDQDTKLIFK